MSNFLITEDYLTEFSINFISVFIIANLFLHCTKMNQRPKIFYNQESRQIQQFSLPKPMIFYMAKNVNSTKVYKKLIQTCKYFYATNSVQFLPCLYFKAYEGNEWRTCSKETSKHICEKAKFNKDTLPKIWLTQSLRFYASQKSPQNSISEIIPKLYRCDVSRLIISQQHLTFEEFLFLTPNVSHFHFHYVYLRYRNQKPVEFETIVEKLSKVEIFKYKFFKDDPSVSLKTVKNLLKIEHFKNIKNLSLQNLPPKFDFNLFYPFLYANKQIKADATFRGPIPEKYKNSTEAYANGTEFQPNNELIEPNGI